MPVSQTVVARLRRLINPAYEEEAKSLLNARHAWKRSRDSFEAVAKLISGMASVVAFAASSVKDSAVVTDWLAFCSGCMGTLSLVLLLFSNYSAKTARERTQELNAILRVAGVTPMPHLVQAPEDGMMEPMDTGFALDSEGDSDAEIQMALAQDAPKKSPRGRKKKKTELSTDTDAV